ncbi:MAG: chromosomal replication initiator protein DnaA [Patescibacteria group bacterium]|nr:chromosomal replication initiator protein DnaA [Patescibacteria group bacterium]
MDIDKIDKRSLWKQTLERVKVSVTLPNYNAWFAPTHLVSISQTSSGYLLTIGCSSSFVKNTLEIRYLGFLQEILKSSLQKHCEIEFVVITDPNKTIPSKEIESSTPLFENLFAKTENIDNKATSCGLRKGYTFTNFAVSSSNQMAWAAAEAVANNPGNAYNPLFIWGGVGVGKTHLMNAIGYTILESQIEANILLCTGEQFTNDIVEGIRNKTTQSVRNKYRKLKALFVDDIQFIAGKDAVQEEFFHTFNALVNSGGQVVLTSDRPPSEIAKLEERLKSRFEAGLIVDIAQPDFELRCAILQIKSKEKGLELDMDIIQTIAANTNSARQIEGFLIRLITEIKVRGIEITPYYVLEMLGKPQKDEGKNINIKLTPDEVVLKIAKYFSIGKRSLLGSSRQKNFVLPRQILMYILRVELGLSLQEIGRVTGGRDHTTVMHAVDKIKQLISTNVNIRGDIEGIKKMLL